MKRAIVNLVSDTAAFIDAQNRLRKSLEGKFHGEFFGFVGEKSVGAPPHIENPYAFKIYAIQRVREEHGYDQILWLDASVYAVKPVDEIFDRIQKLGLFMEEAGHYAGTWCSDRTLEYFGITRDQAMIMPMYSAGFSGFDFRNPKAQEFFAEWKESMLNGQFKGGWNNPGPSFPESKDQRCQGHRHDMTCGSIIANKHGLVKEGYYNSGGKYFAYIGPGYQPPGPDVLFHLQGIVR